MNRIKTLILSVALVSLASTPLFAQSSDITKPTATSAAPPPPTSTAFPDPATLSQTAFNDINTNIDYFNSAKIEIRLGAVSQGAGSSYNSVLAGSYNITENFGIAGDIRNGGQASSGMQSVHLMGELRHAMGNVEITGYLGGGWRWDADTLEAVLGGRLSYIPSIMGAQRWCVWAGPEASVKARDVKETPTASVLAGFGYAFK